MSLLQNQTGALNRLRRCSKEELEKIMGSMEPVSGFVVGALYNADTEGMKQVLLHVNPAGVIAGLKIAAVLTGAKGAELVVRGGRKRTAIAGRCPSGRAASYYYPR